MFDTKLARDIDRYLMNVEEEKPVAFDWQDEPIFEGDEAVNINGELVKKEDAWEYLKCIGEVIR